MKALPIAIAALISVASQVVAQEPGDAARGAKLAGSVCAQCHAVRADQSHSPDPVAPSFANVAGWPGMTDRALRVWLQTSHPTMPSFMLKRRDRDDVVAYILSLRRAGSAL
jgi:mono/diheme cytochrome c family protein